MDKGMTPFASALVAALGLASAAAPAADAALPA
jgi:hypothetical protein